MQKSSKRLHGKSCLQTRTKRSHYNSEDKVIPLRKFLTILSFALAFGLLIFARDKNANSENKSNGIQRDSKRMIVTPWRDLGDHLEVAQRFANSIRLVI